MRRRLARLAALAAASGVGFGASAQADLTTYGYSNARAGALPGPGAISVSGARKLRTLWRANVGGAVSTQPLVVHNVRVRGRRRTVVIVGTEHGELVVLGSGTGAVLWRHQLGRRRITPDCDASPDSVFGITGTPVVDVRAGRVYVADVNGREWALSLRTGHSVSGWPVRIHPRGDDFVWGALTLSRGWLYTPIASLCDAGHYDGGVVAVNVRHPAQMRRWESVRGGAAYAGGIWGWGGLSADRAGDVYGATGNSLGTADEATPHAESVIELTPTLKLRQVNDPLVGPFHSTDRDFGTTPVLIHAAGCSRQVVAINKDGEVFLYDQAHISPGPLQRIRVAGDGTGIPLYGMPAWDQRTRTLVLISPTSPPGGRLRAGLQAWRLGPDCRFTLRWQQSFDYPDAGGPPTIAGNVIYAETGRNGRVRAYRLSDGAPLWTHKLSSSTATGGTSVDSGSLYVADWTGHVWRFAPRR